MAAQNKIPFFDLTRQYKTIKAEVLKSYEDLLDRQALIMGDAVSKFEQEIAQWIGVKHAITCASGTDALILPLKALGIGPGDEVITPAYSFFASTSSILLAGATPVFVDVDPVTMNIDVRKIEAAITPKTKMIMPVHLYGQCADMDAVNEIAKKHKLLVMEDFAQSIGATFKGRQAGTMSTVGATSFYPTKNLGGSGDGGLMITNDDALADKLKLIRVHGMRIRYTHEFLGTNSRLDALQCAYLRIKLPRLNGWMQRRQQLADRYMKELAPLKSYGLILPETAEGRTHVWNQFCIRVNQRDQVKQTLAENGIPTEIYYPFTVPHQEPLRPYAPKTGWAVSEDCARTSMALPIFPELTDEEQGLVIAALKAAIPQHAVSNAGANRTQPHLNG